MTSMVLRNARDLVQQGWTQGRLFTRSRSSRAVCLEGALLLGAGYTEYDCLASRADERELRPEHGAYVNATHLLIDILGMPAHLWNDKPERTQQDVIDVLNAAIAIAYRREEAGMRMLDLVPSPITAKDVAQHVAPLTEIGAVCA